MKRPSLDDMATAAEWLEANEGSDGEKEACSRVAVWLDAYAKESAEREGARMVGCTVAYFRKYMQIWTCPICKEPNRSTQTACMTIDCPGKP